MAGHLGDHTFQYVSQLHKSILESSLTYIETLGLGVGELFSGTRLFCCLPLGVLQFSLSEGMY